MTGTELESSLLEDRARRLVVLARRTGGEALSLATQQIEAARSHIDRGRLSAARDQLDVVQFQTLWPHVAPL